jgi:hypothetical protein
MECIQFTLPSLKADLAKNSHSRQPALQEVPCLTL